jgi:nitrogen fixation/metabolism regulation signal transduction histidine kinase
LEAIQTEIDDLKERLIDLKHPFELAKSELRARETALKTARKALATGIDGRRKAEAVSSVIESIVCHFDHKSGLKTNGRSKLVKLEFQPVSGDALNIVTKGSKLGPS